MNNNLIRAFQSHPMFYNISIANCATLMNCLGCIEKAYKKDQIISSSEVYTRQIGIVIAGCVHAVQEDLWGRGTFLSYTNNDGIFGELLIGGHLQDRGIVFKAAEPTTVLFLPLDRIMFPCRNSCPFHQQLSKNLFNMISLRNAALTEKIEITSKSTLRDKVLTYLSIEAQKAGSTTITVPLNRTEMADYLCTNRSALSRELANMKKDGILDYDHRVFHLLNTSENQ